MTSNSQPAPEPGQVWEATSGHWRGDVVELVRDTGQAWVVNRRSRSAGRKGPAHTEARNIPHDYFEIHYEFREPAARRKGGASPRTRRVREATIVQPTPANTNGQTHVEGPVPTWRVRYRVAVQQIEFQANTLLDVASEMEQFAPGCEVLSAEKITP